MKIFVSLLLSLFLCGAAQAQIYKTTDENGRVIYTDTPTDKTEQVQLKETNLAPGVNVRNHAETPSDGKPKGMDKLPYELYITSPAPETHLNPGDRNLTVSFQVNRALEDGLRYQVLSNGEPAGSSSTEASITIPEIYRGEHQISVIIYDEYQEVLAESEPVTVYVHRAKAPQAVPYKK